MTGWLLAIDTATDALSVAIGKDGVPVFAGWQRRRKGHAEELAPLIDRTLRTADLSPGHLEAIAVTVGPGTFTGVRIGLAAARGMRIALKIPVVGLNTLELLAFQAGRRWPERPVMAALDARRGQVYAQYFGDMTGAWPSPWSAPAAMPAAQAAGMLVGDSILCGSGAGLIADAATQDKVRKAAPILPDAGAILELLADRPIPAASMPPPSPLYLRAPDAIPAKPVLNL